MAHRRPRCSTWGPRSTWGVLSWFPWRVGGRSQSGRTAGVKPDETGPQRKRSGLIPDGRSDSVRRRCGKGPRTNPTSYQPAADKQTGPPPGEESPPEALPLTSRNHHTRRTPANKNVCGSDSGSRAVVYTNTATRLPDLRLGRELRHTHEAVLHHGEAVKNRL